MLKRHLPGRALEGSPPLSAGTQSAGPRGEPPERRRLGLDLPRALPKGRRLGLDLPRALPEGRQLGQGRSMPPPERALPAQEQPLQARAGAKRHRLPAASSSRPAVSTSTGHRRRRTSPPVHPSSLVQLTNADSPKCGCETISCHALQPSTRHRLGSDRDVGTAGHPPPPPAVDRLGDADPGSPSRA